MGETKAKPTARRTKKAANSPAPSGMGGTTCGHSACGTTCNVRYCGPTTHIRDHHIVHAARGVAHVWTAAIVAGFAVVLTGAIAYTAVQASTSSDVSLGTVLSEVRDLNARLDAMQASLIQLKAQCTAKGTQCLPTSTSH
jgi:hypothetical protein